MSRANIEIEGDFAASGKESTPVEFLEGITSTVHLTQLGSMSLPDTSMAGDLIIIWEPLQNNLYNSGRSFTAPYAAGAAAVWARRNDQVIF